MAEKWIKPVKTGEKGLVITCLICYTISMLSLIHIYKMLSNAIEKAQKKIENNNFGIRKNLLEYDQVMNEQREIIYEERRQVLDGENMRDPIYHMITDYVENTVDRCVSADQDSEEWDLTELEVSLKNTIPSLALPTKEDISGMQQKELKHCLLYTSRCV